MRLRAASPGAPSLRYGAAWSACGLLAVLAVAWLPLLPTLPALLSFGGLSELAEPRLRALFLRTAAFAAGSALIASLVGAPLGLIAARVRMRGAEVLELLLPLPLLLPPLLIAQSWHGLTGMDGMSSALFCLGLCYAPLPALLVARALARQGIGAHQAAVLAGGRRLALAEMARCAAPAAVLGGALAFLFTLTDFAVADYFGAVGEKFTVYSFEVFTHWRESDYRGGARAAAPLVALAGAVLFFTLLWGDRDVGGGGASRPPRLGLGRGNWIAGGLGIALIAMVLVVPLGRVLYETGMRGPVGEGAWLARSGAAFRDAAQRGGPDLGRSIVTGLMAGALAMVLAPVPAHLLARMRPGAARSLLGVAIALPLLAPAVGYGLGAILVFNRDLFGNFYESRLLPAVVLAGRYTPLAVFLLAERLRALPRSGEQAAALAGISQPAVLWRQRLAAQRPAWLLAGGLVLVFAIRELDLAVLLPGANRSAAVRYYNALHFARDNFVAAFGAMIAAVLFLPLALQAAVRGLRPATETA